ncbi:MAG: hypothetical protein HYX25_03070 [Candidatus Solibacter usitatus]|nr:hypothetical protein [Candidatus Solibacter usitatus]
MKLAIRLFAGSALLLGLSSFAAFAQSVISAKSGLIHYVEGKVLLAGEPVESHLGSFPDIKENAQLRTEQGRAEVLLTPGVVLRIGESSAIRMVTNRLIDTRLEFLSGSAVVEAADLPKDNGVSIVYNDYAVRLMKKGIYRFDSEPAQLRVYDGEAQVQADGKIVSVTDGRMMAFSGEMAVNKFDTKDGDALYRWAKRRAEYFAVANVSAARSVSQSGSSFASSGWVYNPYFSMFTYVPLNGMFYSPFGFAYWSPFTVYRAYYYGPMAFSRGQSTMPATSTAPGRVATGNSGASAAMNRGVSPRIGGLSAGSGQAAPVARASGGRAGGR